VLPCESCRRTRLRVVVADYVYRGYGGHDVVMRYMPMLRCPCGVTQVRIPFVDDLHRLLGAYYRDKVNRAGPRTTSQRVWAEIYGVPMAEARYWRAEERDQVLLVSLIDPELQDPALDVADLP
jgi:hypothetical protein